MRRKIVFTLAGLFLVAIAGVYAAWSRFLDFLASPARPGGEERVVSIPERALPELAPLLAEQGLVAREDWASLYLERFYVGGPVIAGEYRLSAGMSPVEIMKRLQSGKVVTYTLSIQPGMTAEEILELLERQELGKKSELNALVYDRRFIDELGVPSDSLEGFLFPDAFDLPKGMPARALLSTLVKQYRRAVGPELVESARNAGLTELELITLASLIEKGPVQAGERRLYSAVLHNRLKQKLPLESEASMDYGLARLGKTRETASKEEKRHAWSTDTLLGLPASPIASPSLASINAAADPASSQALYFARRADGSHVFCDDWECYAAAVYEQTGATPVRPKKKATER